MTQRSWRGTQTRRRPRDAAPRRVSTTCTGRRSAAASRSTARSPACSPRTTTSRCSGPSPSTSSGRASGLGVDVSACGSARVVDDVDATDGERRLRPVRQRHVPEPGRQPERARAGTTCTSRRSRPTRRTAARHHFGRRRRTGARRVPRLPRPPPSRCAPASTVGSCAPTSSPRTSASSPTLGSPPAGSSGCGVCRADVLYPPVRPEVGAGGQAPLILYVGRFFDPRYGHCKKQLELIEAFTRHGLDGWTLAARRRVRRRQPRLRARRSPGRAGPPGRRARQRHGGARPPTCSPTASIYWHAGGLGEDPDRHPDRFEHFGITVVEAMAAGAVPLVFAAGGPAEIVEHGVNGFHWHRRRRARRRSPGDSSTIPASVSAGRRGGDRPGPPTSPPTGSR